MKIFIPMSDAVLGDNGTVLQELVPFNTDFFGTSQTPREGAKPSNWISDCDYEGARKRLFSLQA